MPTALELSRDEWQPYIKAARKRLSMPKLSVSEQQERDELLTRVREAASQLKDQFGVQRVILFGSWAQSEWSISTSDVDLAVEGLSQDDFWDAWRIVEAIINDHSVDLIEIETATESLRSAILKQGIDM